MSEQLHTNLSHRKHQTAIGFSKQVAASIIKVLWCFCAGNQG